MPHPTPTGPTPCAHCPEPAAYVLLLPDELLPLCASHVPSAEKVVPFVHTEEVVEYRRPALYPFSVTCRAGRTHYQWTRFSPTLEAAVRSAEQVIREEWPGKGRAERILRTLDVQPMPPSEDPRLDPRPVGLDALAEGE